ncbi:MAG: metallophosphoesterase family protein [Devosia sp.]|nr:metallophosphoesterase family protein [Devosia sp.]
MRLAVISDVHGNRFALEAVLDDIAARSVDSTVNLGDLVSGPMEPNWTADILMDAGLPTIRGNHERWLVERSPFGLDPVDRFTMTQLEQRHLDWFAALPATLAILGEIYMCHGTPANDSEPWLDNWWQGRSTKLPDEAEVSAKANGLDFPVLLCGHTHLARAVRLRDGRLIVNPGSVGLQINHGSPDARYAIIERKDGRWAVSLRAVPYDHTAAARQATANGFPRWTEALTTGWSGPDGLF